MDINDSVGILDSYFPECRFFLDQTEFALYLNDNPIDYLVVCTPNDRHLFGCILGLLHIGCDVICEKPLVTDLSSIVTLKRLEDFSGRSVYTILQLRHHPVVIEIRNFISDEMAKGNPISMAVFYYTARGDWYNKSWKGDITKSGGLLFNIGIHLFDLMVLVFGEPISLSGQWFDKTGKTAHGDLQSKNFNANIYWELSTDSGLLKIGRTRREIIVNDKSFSLDNGFTDLHTESYMQILAGNGFGIEEVRPSIALTEMITNQLYRP
jgi:UDP-N-acetyl-2-amino-2-deoxyglucuronate dehydrogenase